MKKHLTNTVEVTIDGKETQRFIGPRENVKPILRLLSHEGFTPVSDLSWRQAFNSEIGNYGEPAMALRGLRLREGLTQMQLAKKLKLAPYNLSKMENGKRPISKKMALKLSKILKTDYRVFL